MLTTDSIKVSVLLLAYNQEATIQDAFESILNQDWSDIEVVVSDDCSSDGTWPLLNEIATQYIGTKRIVLNRNPRNLGIVGNYFHAFSLSSGDLLFCAAGDDISLPSRVSQCISCWRAYAERPELVASDAFDMDIDGSVLGIKKTDPLEDWDLVRWHQKRPFIFGASFMMTRRLLAMRSINHKLLTEDQILLVRALMMGGGVRCATPLVKHRRGGASQTRRLWNYETKRDAFMKSAYQSLFEIDEILLDASLLNQEIRWAVTELTQLNKYILEIINTAGLIKKIQVTAKYQGVPIRKRLRYFFFSAFPWWYSKLFWVKAKRHT